MDHSTLMECGNYFALCNNCQNITVRDFSKCHKCCHKFPNYIDKQNYKQSSCMDKYDILIKGLMTFEIDVLEDCHSMVSISIIGDKSFTPELYQIRKENNQYTYIHFEGDTHNILEEYIVDPSSFTPKLDDNLKYEVSLAYGPNIIYIHQ